MTTANSPSRVGAWVRRRLSPESYLGLHLTIGLLLTLMGLALFGVLADNVRDQDDFTQWDLPVANALHNEATPLGLTFFRAVTTLGNVETIVTLTIGTTIVLLARRHWLMLGGFLLAQAGGGLLNVVLKEFFQRPRPVFADPFVVESSWSFPSGHAMGSLIGYGMLAYLLILIVRQRWWRILIGGLAATIILLVGFSRMYLGAHYLSDVIAGFAAGLVWLSTCVSGVDVARRRKRQQLAATSSNDQALLKEPLDIR